MRAVYYPSKVGGCRFIFVSGFETHKIYNLVSCVRAQIKQSRARLRRIGIHFVSNDGTNEDGNGYLMKLKISTYLLSRYQGGDAKSE